MTRIVVKRAEKQERHLAAEMRGKRQPGSGNQPHSKGDVKTSRFLIDCKFTDSGQYILRDRDIEKLRREALFERREWCFQVNIGCHRVVILPIHMLEELESAV